MRKILVITILMLLGCLNSYSQTIHWIFFIDTSDLYLGNDNSNAKRALEKHFVNKVNAALSLKGYINNVHYYTGSDCTATSCRGVLKNLSCSNKDIVIFYYIGHGRSSNDGTQWPMMEFTNSQNYISLNEVHQTLKAQKPQLVFSVGMCCNKVRPQLGQQTGLSQQSKRYKIVSKNFAKKIQKLFLSNKGDVIIAAASSGQEAQGGCKFENGEMDYFTSALCMIIDSYAASSEEDLTWARFMKDISYWTHFHVNNEVKDDHERPMQQRPYYKINIQSTK